jgi:hypothetical protein
MILGAKGMGDPPRGLKFDPVSLSVIEADRVGFMSP